MIKIQKYLLFEFFGLKCCLHPFMPRWRCQRRISAKTAPIQLHHTVERNVHYSIDNSCIGGGGLMPTALPPFFSPASSWVERNPNLWSYNVITILLQSFLSYLFLSPLFFSSFYFSFTLSLSILFSFYLFLFSLHLFFSLPMYISFSLSISPFLFLFLYLPFSFYISLSLSSFLFLYLRLLIFTACQCNKIYPYLFW